ncbi:MAG: hypothetical protein Q4B42_04115 [Oscillospiraceae bacterium]|nr:hypothetical protein [Oscillospiraceae bacterium]
MKRFLLSCAVLLILAALAAYLLLYTSFVPVKAQEQQPLAFTQGKNIYLYNDGKPELFEIKGVDLGSGLPGHFATEFAIDYDTYIEWFGLMREMNANTVRIYTISDPVFYEALYDFNSAREDPLYLLQGVWVDDDVMRASNDAYASEFIDVFTEDCRKAVDVIHGRRSIGYHSRYGFGHYYHDVSEWTLGYIIGVEWEPDIVLYTDDLRESLASFEGDYLYTDADASAFEAMLARVGNEMLRYETQKYGQQRLLAFSNWPETDPLVHEQWRRQRNTNLARIDVEHIHPTDKVNSGMFASYHIYPYYPAFLDFEEVYADYTDENGQANPYLGYLRAITGHHTIPVVISEFGLPSSRGIARINLATGMNQGNLSESEQAERLPVLYENIKRAGCAGAIVFEWQDEWFKRTWNTWPEVNLARNAYWSDYQTNEQSFGLITFDPGEEESVVYVDGSLEDWAQTEAIAERDGLRLKMQYDEKYIYFCVEYPGLSEDSLLYLPIDLTPNSGAYYSEDQRLSFSRPVDFLVRINGEEDSEVFVQEYYDCVYATLRREIWEEDAYINPPDKDSAKFNTILQLLRYRTYLTDDTELEPWTFPTGRLTMGNGNPSSPAFNSLSDFCFGENAVEIRLPWLLLNFSDPSTMQIHDDYYENYGIEEIGIEAIYVSAQVYSGAKSSLTPFAEFELKGWENNPSWHMRLKASYYAMQSAFGEED